MSLIHHYTSHGDPFVQAFTDTLLEAVSKPFFVCLAKWIYEGELHDPYEEFFIQLNPDMKAVQFGSKRRGLVVGAGFAIDMLDVNASQDDEDGGVEAHQLWEKKFLLRSEMLPNFVNDTFSRKVRNTLQSWDHSEYTNFRSIRLANL